MRDDSRGCMIIEAPTFVTLSREEVFVHTTHTYGVDRLEFQAKPVSARCGNIVGRTTIDVCTGDVIESVRFTPETWNEKCRKEDS